MLVKIGQKNIEVEVSDGGVFHDKETKTISSNTLKGLIKKIKAAKFPKSSVPVEFISTGNKGTIIGRVSQKGWKRHNFTVKMDDGDMIETSSYDMGKIATSDEKANLEMLKSKTAEAQEVYNKALQEQSLYKHKIHYIDLDELFPLG